MRIRETIEIINSMKANGIIEAYAIGGAVAAGFYLEPTTTMDMDIFIPVHVEADSQLVVLGPLYKHLREQGFPMEGEYFIIADTPVQFLPPTSPLVEEAINAAATKDIDGTPAMVFTPEHLAAIALETGRGKDKLRLLQFLEPGVLEEPRFQAILERHKLAQRLKRFIKQYSDEMP